MVDLIHVTKPFGFWFGVVSRPLDRSCSRVRFRRSRVDLDSTVTGVRSFLHEIFFWTRFTLGLRVRRVVRRHSIMSTTEPKFFTKVV